MVNAIQGLLATEDGTPLIPYVNPASKEEFGVVKVDNDTIKIDENGVITGTNVLIAGDNIEIENNVISAKNGAMPIGTVFPLNCTSYYVPEGCLPCDGAEYSKSQFEQFWDNYLTGEDVTYTLDNRLILGENVTINNGFINFENTVFNEFSFSEDIKDGKEIVVNFIHDGSKGNEQRLIASEDGLYLSIINGYIGIADGSSFSGDSLELTQNNFFVKMKGTNIETSIVDLLFSLSFDGIDFVEIGHWNTMLNVAPDSSKFSIYQFYGQIDLTKSYFSPDGTNKEYLCAKKTNSLLNTCTYEEYEQDLATYGQCGKFAVKPLDYDGAELSVVGSPTVTEDGIYSNGSTTNYLTIPNSIVKQLEGNNAWKINFGGVMPLTQYYSNITGENSFNTGRLNIGSINGSGNFFLHLYNENDVAYGVYIPAGVKNNFGKEFIGYCSYDGSQTYTVALSFDNGITWQIETKAITDTVYFGESDLKIGYNLQTGNIDLKQFSIIVNGKTIFDCVEGGTFKVPTIKDGAIVQQAMSDSELGQAYNEGLPNIYGNLATIGIGGTTDGAFEKVNQSGGKITNDGDNDWQVDFDASRCSDIYGKTSDTSLNKVQMNAIALRYFVVVANGTIEESAMNWSEWASSLQAKANKTDVDGQWVASDLVLSTALAVGEYEIDLADYLPNDGYNYELLLMAIGVRNETDSAQAFLKSSVISTYYLFHDSSSNAYATCSQGIFIVGADKKITLQIAGKSYSRGFELKSYAYRRLGRNV